MRSTTQQLTWNSVSFFGLLSGLAVLFLCLFFEECRVLGIPAMLAVFGSLLYGMK